MTMTRPALAAPAAASTHGTGWKKDAAGEWTTTPGYCWCGVRARSCPEPKQHVTFSDTIDLDEPPAGPRPRHMPAGVDFFGLSL